MDTEKPDKPKKKRRYDRYNALDKALRRSGIECSGKVASLIFKTFCENSGILEAADVEAKGLCAKGTFKAWRKKLIDAGWIEWDYNRASLSGHLSRHFATDAVLEYLNPDTIKTQQLATSEQLYRGLAAKADRVELEAQKAKVESLESKIEALEQRLAARESRETVYLAALRNAAALILETTDTETIERLVKNMILDAEGGEEVAVPEEALLAN